MVVMLTQADYLDAEAYCLANSFWLRRMRKRSCWLIRQTAETVAVSGWTDKEVLFTRLSIRVRTRYVGSPLLIWILLKIILPIVIRLILEWWKRRNES